MDILAAAMAAWLIGAQDKPTRTPRPQRTPRPTRTLKAVPTIGDKDHGGKGKSEKAKAADKSKTKDIWNNAKPEDAPGQVKKLAEITQMCMADNPTNTDKWDRKWGNANGRGRVLKKSGKTLAFTTLPPAFEESVRNINGKMYCPFDIIVLNTQEADVQDDGIALYKTFSMDVVGDLQGMGYDGLYVITPKRIGDSDDKLPGYFVTLGELGFTEYVYKMDVDGNATKWLYTVDFNEVQTGMILDAARGGV